MAISVRSYSRRLNALLAEQERQRRRPVPSDTAASNHSTKSARQNQHGTSSTSTTVSICSHNMNVVNMQPTNRTPKTASNAQVCNRCKVTDDNRRWTDRCAFADRYGDERRRGARLVALDCQEDQRRLQPQRSSVSATASDTNTQRHLYGYKGDLFTTACAAVYVDP